MNKKIIFIVLALTLTLLSGCGDKQQKETESALATGNTVAGTLKAEAEVEEKVEEVKEEAQEPIVLAEKGELHCSLPEGFVEYEEEAGVYVCKKFPKEIACISYVIAGYDDNMEEISEQIIKERLEKDMLDSYKEEVDVKVIDYKEYQIDGSKAVKVEVAFNVMGGDYEQIQLLVFDETKHEEHILSYIQEAGEDWMDEFRESVDTVSFKG